MTKAMRSAHARPSPRPLFCCTAAIYIPSRKRKETIMFKFLKNLILHLSTPTEQDRERAYLNAAISVADLERRQREIDQGLLRGPRFAF
jgi:hypothetical protein